MAGNGLRERRLRLRRCGGLARTGRPELGQQRGPITSAQRGQQERVGVEGLGEHVVHGRDMFARVPLRPPPERAPFDGQEDLFPGDSDAHSGAGDGAGDGRDVPFGRRVVEHLHQAVAAAHDAAHEVAREGRRESFAEAVQRGVSANLCEALSALGGTQADRPFEVGFSWARGLPSEVPPTSLQFSETLTRIVAQGAKDLRELNASGRVTIVGRIERLVIDPYPHRVLVRGQLETRGGTEEGSVWVRLGAADYERASREHLRPGVRFRFSGHLVKAAGRIDLILDRPGFDVIGPD
jgi:hypothetical protein